jgi:hypothetical protein
MNRSGVGSAKAENGDSLRAWPRIRVGISFERRAESDTF